MVSQNWTADSIKHLLDRNDTAVERAVLAIFHRQTSDEQDSGTTKHHNGRGFNAFHAERGTYYANWIQSGHRLTGVHLERARRMAKRYVGQLAEIAQSHSPKPHVAQQGIGERP